MVSTPNSFDLPELEPEAITKGDPLLKLITRIKASPIVIGAGFSAVFNLLRMLAAWRVGHLHTVGSVTGFFEDPGMYANLFAGAVIWIYYTWMPRGIVAALKGLLANKVIGPPTPATTTKRGKEYSYALFLAEMQTLFGRWWWSAMSLTIAAGATSILLLPRYLARMKGQDSWSMADPLNLTLSLSWALINTYCVALLLIYCVLSVLRFSRLFTKFTVYVQPLHPDRAGGLSPLGNFSLALSYIVTLIGLLLVTTPITRHFLEVGTIGFKWTPDILVGLGVYVVAAPIVFFAPLSVTHNAMQNAKDLLLLQIAQRFEAEYISVQNALDGDISGLDNSLKILKELHSLHEVTSEFPVWPFNSENMVRFATTLVSPIALAIVADWLSKLIAG